METDGHWEIASVVVLLEESIFSIGSESRNGDLSQAKMPETGFLGRDWAFLGAREDESEWREGYCLRCR